MATKFIIIIILLKYLNIFNSLFHSGEQKFSIEVLLIFITNRIIGENFVLIWACLLYQGFHSQGLNLHMKLKNWVI